MTAAYREAEDPDVSGLSDDLQKLWLIDRFGVRAVLGRDTLYAHEITRMIAAENVYKALRSRTNSDDWAKWASDNKRAAELLAHVEKIING